MLYTTLKAFGLTNNIPVAYRFFKEPQKLPFLVYYEERSDNFVADNQIYLKKSVYTVELYTQDKDPGLEALLEAALDGYIWEKTEDYIDTEQMYQITYELEE